MLNTTTINQINQYNEQKDQYALKTNKNSHLYVYTVNSTGNQDIDTYRVHKFHQLKLKKYDILIIYAYNDGIRNVGVSTGSEIRKTFDDSLVNNILTDEKNYNLLKSNQYQQYNQGLENLIYVSNSFQNYITFNVKDDYMKSYFKLQKELQIKQEQNTAPFIHFMTIFSLSSLVAAIFFAIVFSIKMFYLQKSFKTLEKAYSGRHYLLKKGFVQVKSLYHNDLYGDITKKVYSWLPDDQLEYEKLLFNLNLKNHNNFNSFLNALKNGEVFQNPFLISNHTDLLKLQKLYDQGRIADRLFKNTVYHLKFSTYDKYSFFLDVLYHMDPEKLMLLYADLPILSNESKKIYTNGLEKILPKDQFEKDFKSMSKRELGHKYGDKSDYTRSGNNYYNDDLLIPSIIYSNLPTNSNDPTSSNYVSSSSDIGGSFGGGSI